MDNSESNNESNDTPSVSPFLDYDDESDNVELINELNKYGNAGKFYHNRIINSIDGNDLTFPCMIGFKKFVAYFDPFLPMNIITHKAYNTVMVEGLKSKRRNLIAMVRDVYVFVGSFTYVTDFVVLEENEEFIVSDMADVVMGRPFRVVSQLEYDCVKGLISFTMIFDTYIFQMPHTIPGLRTVIGVRSHQY
uniref:MAK10-like protein n=1 Tax=Tanacetum cinerariifolium TaxID=118510 RepID=A0A699RN62_TANCI|nr:MAK10-like protein [Tanacetum cinerariifolium]